MVLAHRDGASGVVNVDAVLQVEPLFRQLETLRDQIYGDGFRDVWAQLLAGQHPELLPPEGETLVRATSPSPTRHCDRLLAADIRVRRSCRRRTGARRYRCDARTEDPVPHRCGIPTRRGVSRVSRAQLSGSSNRCAARERPLPARRSSHRVRGSCWRPREVGPRAHARPPCRSSAPCDLAWSRAPLSDASRATIGSERPTAMAVSVLVRKHGFGEPSHRCPPQLAATCSTTARPRPGSASTASPNCSIP